ncbi:MAG: UDP-N-acetylglucosamine 2-epimerase (non-hydrolyzing) [Verrucomicrobiae bacterium]|nr:UDP-N-acetylglucosamine 2-epimerase (non-hydrolyzing) [Verrucomicrobiae bacterium]
MKKRVLNVVGARPNFMKMAPLMWAYREYPEEFEPVLIHTGQHYDANMSDAFFEQLGLPEPDVYLGIGSGSHGEQTGRMLIELEKVMQRDRPDLVVVVGDVNSTLAGALAAAKLCIPVAHVEAGLRSFDPTMPEEINRKLTDAISEYLFITSEDARENLVREGVAAEKIYFVGNVMIDTLMRMKDLAARLDVRSKLGLDGEFGFVTLHRPSNVDERETLAGILQALRTIQEELPLVFAVHPRTRARMEQFGFWQEVSDLPRLKVTEPLAYLDSLCLMQHARLVLTDSGGVQEETTALGVPCLTLRKNTERPVTVTEGTNTLVGTDPDRIVEAAREVIRSRGKRGRVPKLWDGKAAQRIVEVLRQK